MENQAQVVSIQLRDQKKEEMLNMRIDEFFCYLDANRRERNLITSLIELCEDLTGSQIGQVTIRQMLAIPKDVFNNRSTGKPKKIYEYAQERLAVYGLKFNDQ